MSSRGHPVARAQAEPVSAHRRIISLDALRGFAILGILIMNIQAFSMIEAAYLNPTAYGDLTGLNRWVWVLSHLFADFKFISIFSMLFGAGIVLFASRLEAKSLRPGVIHYRRTFWLIVIGSAHGFLLWYGDILVTYGLLALVVYLLWRLSPKPLLIIGLVVFAVPSALYLLTGVSIRNAPPEVLEDMLVCWCPAAEAVARELAAYGGSWTEQMSCRVPAMRTGLTLVFGMLHAWRCGGLMLVGMALFKWGVLSAKRSRRFYSVVAAVGFGVGLPLIGLGVARRFAADWAIEYAFFRGWQYNYWGSLLVALAYISVIMLVAKSHPRGRFVRTLAAVGRMALTNYLLQTVICTTLFYGHGLGLFGLVERSCQILVVFAVWILQLCLSPIWLRFFRFGPAEWLWRTLTYLKPQPMRRLREPADAARAGTRPA